jgi:hypothetical protein
MELREGREATVKAAKTQKEEEGIQRIEGEEEVVVAD